MSDVVKVAAESLREKDVIEIASVRFLVVGVKREPEGLHPFFWVRLHLVNIATGERTVTMWHRRYLVQLV